MLVVDSAYAQEKPNVVIMVIPGVAFRPIRVSTSGTGFPIQRTSRFIRPVFNSIRQLSKLLTLCKV